MSHLIEKFTDNLQELGILPFKTEEIKGRGQPKNTLSNVDLSRQISRFEIR